MSKTYVLLLALMFSIGSGFCQSTLAQHSRGGDQAEAGSSIDNILASGQDSLLMEAFPFLRTLIDLLSHPYLISPYPKSLDRFDFSSDMADGLIASDGAALLTAFSAGAVNKALEILPQRPERLVVCGGGRHNPTLMQALRDRTGAEVIAAEAIGWRGDAVEAECFAYLAVRSLHGLPNSFPETTGVPVPTCGGVVHWAK